MIFLNLYIYISNSEKKNIEKLATKTELKAEQDKLEKLQTYDSILFIGQSYFINDGSQNASIFQPIYNTFTMPAGFTDIIVEWESKGLWNEKNNLPITELVFLQTLWMNNSKIRIRFKGSC